MSPPLDEEVLGLALRTQLDVETKALADPPLGGLVSEALRQGRRRRRARQVTLVAAAGATASLVVAAAVALPGLGGGASASRTASVTEQRTRPAPERSSPATDLQHELTEAMARAGVKGTITVTLRPGLVQVTLDGEHGQGSFRLGLEQDRAYRPDSIATLLTEAYPGFGLTRRPDGSQVGLLEHSDVTVMPDGRVSYVTHDGTICAGSARVSVLHPTGEILALHDPSCPDPGGPGALTDLPLTLPQALALTSDPAVLAAVREALPRPGPTRPALDQRTVAHQVTAALARLGVGGRITVAAVPETTRMLEVNIAGEHGPGMFRIEVFDDAIYRPDASAAAGLDQDLALMLQPDDTRTGTDDLGRSVRVLPDGRVVKVGQLPDNCIQSEIVEVRRPDGIKVSIDNATCLAWNGTTNPASGRPLTTEQAVALASDPTIGAA
jgi:hypothetical protein